MQRQLLITILIFSIEYSFNIASVHFGMAIWPGASYRPPYYGKESPNTFNSAPPRTYSIICISSESCLGSIVGFARLLCFGTLCSAILAKVAQGELLRLCPDSSGRAPQQRKPKTDYHDAVRARGGHITRKPMSRTEITATEAEYTETEYFSGMFGLHMLKTELSSVNSGLSLGYPSGLKTE